MPPTAGTRKGARPTKPADSSVPAFILAEKHLAEMARNAPANFASVWSNLIKQPGKVAKSIEQGIGDLNLALAQFVSRGPEVPAGSARYQIPGRPDVEAYIAPGGQGVGEAETAMGRRLVMTAPISHPTMAHELTHIDQARRWGLAAPAAYAVMAAFRSGASHPFEKEALQVEARARKEKRPAPAAARGMISYTRGR